mgnify:CR=1 FL=1
MALVLQNIKAAYSNLKNYIPETLKAFEHETGLQLTFANYFKHHDLMTEKVLAMKTARMESENENGSRPRSIRRARPSGSTITLPGKTMRT